MAPCPLHLSIPLPPWRLHVIDFKPNTRGEGCGRPFEAVVLPCLRNGIGEGKMIGRG